MATRYLTVAPSITPSTQPTSTTSLLRLRGGNRTPQVETVTENDPDDTPTNNNSNNNNTPAGRPTTKPASVEAVYDLIADVDAPDLAIITPSCVPLHRKNEHLERSMQISSYM